MVIMAWYIKWNGALLGKSKNFFMIDGLKYFSPETLNLKNFKENGKQEESPKGLIKYYDIIVNGEVNEDAAWYYSKPTEEAITFIGSDFTNYVAFGKDVDLSIYP
ncbi:MAG: DUF427 domain-containing protein [Methanolobus sp.]|nr:DUF427 domain-containing protein [Methanolobus sp.]